MANPISSFDWSLVEAFLAVAETGSLSAAARRLGTSQPTMGRQIREIEAATGAALFDRQARGMGLTETGTALLAPAQAMRDAAGRFSVLAAGAGQELSGTVRITASTFTAHYILPPIVARMRRAEPEIALEIVASDTADNLLFREADIAIRMFRPGQLDVVTRHIGDAPLALFGATAYLDRKGRPSAVADLPEHEFVGYDRDDRIIRGFRDTGWEVERSFFRTRCDAQPVYWELVRAGCGLGFGHRGVGRADPVLEEIVLDLPIPALPVWLTAHEALRATPRIRRVWDLLAAELGGVLS